MNWWLIAGGVGWLMCSRVAYRTFLIAHYKRFKRVTRGDIAFFCYLAAHGPIALPAALLARCDDPMSRFWSKQVWPKEYQSFLHD